MANGGSEGAVGALGHFSWALLDQVLISAVNFLSIVLIARRESQEALGYFTLVYSAFLFVNSIQAGIITQPHNILGVGRQGEDYRRYTTSTGLGQLLLAGLAAGLALGAYGIAWMAEWGHASLLLALAPCIVGWQVEEFARRALYTEGRITSAFCVDLVAYGGQAVAVVVLWRREMLTGATAFYAIAGASAIGAGVGLWLLRGSLSWRIDRGALWENWHFGKWIAGGEIVGQWLSVQLYVYISAALLGAAAAGVFRAVHTIFGPSRIVADVCCTVLPIRFAKAFALRGRSAVHAQMIASYLIAAPALGAYCALAAIFARPLLWGLYRERYLGAAPVLATFAAPTFVGYMTMIIGAALRARRLTRSVFNCRLVASVVALPIGYALIRALGIQGTVLGMLLTNVALGTMLWLVYQQSGRIEHEGAGR